MDGLFRQQQLAMTLSCLSSSINICWPGTMVSLLILMHPPHGLQGGWISTVGISCPVALLNIPMSSLGLFKVSQIHFFSFLFFILIPVCCPSPPPLASWCYLSCFVIPPLVGSRSAVFVSLWCERSWWFPLIRRAIHWTGCTEAFDQASDFMNSDAARSDQHISALYERMVPLCWQSRDKFVASKGKCLKQINASGLQLSVSLSWCLFSVIMNTCSKQALGMLVY